MLQVAFAGTFSATLEPSVRARLTMPCDVVMGDETGIVSRLGDVDGWSPWPSTARWRRPRRI